MITLSQVKSYLGITGTTYDAQISLMIPIVEADVRRILNHSFHEKVYATITSGSADITLYSAYGINVKPVDHPIEVGRVIDSICFSEGTYVTAFDEETLVATLSTTAIASGTYLFTSIDIGMWFTLSKMVWFKISKLNTNNDWEKVQSKTMGVVSVTFATNIDQRTGYPADLMKDLGSPFQRV